MRSGRIVHGALLLLAAVTSANSAKCNRLIDGVTAPKSNAEGRYNFVMTQYNRTIYNFYMPNTRYNVTLRINDIDLLHRKFTRFLISAEPENENDTADVGIFDIQDDQPDGLTKFAENCVNAVTETSMLPKNEITFGWISPSEGSGCIFFRATVLESPDIWYMDDFDLNMKVCQDTKAEADDQGPVLKECLACNEAKYEITFEGLWSRNTHPKDFPTKSWLIRFSDVIGASHTGDYRFWTYNGFASDGLRQVAEHGATRKLESELKNQSDHIRTIIKARGISYPNVTGKTFAVFRVDRKHHLMSLVSMIDPSPDWFVGVSDLELCLPNRSWIEHKELNLYPYDAGTDDGITYLSPDSPTVPQDFIQRITSTCPNDTRSPFYDPTGLDMKPLAKLYLNRQRLYDKTCEVVSETSGEASSMEPRKKKACRVTSWGEWGPCLVSCGKGKQLRQRKFRNEVAAVANKCNNTLTDRMNCFNMLNPYCTGPEHYGGILDTETCTLNEWSDWSECSTTCGEGYKMKHRNFKHKIHRKKCKAVPGGPSLQQTIDCENEPCEGEDADKVREDTNHMDNYDDYGGRGRERRDGKVFEDWLQECDDNLYTPWSFWSPCSSSCGLGVRMRSRLLKKNWYTMGKEYEDDNEDCRSQQTSCTANIKSCNFTKEEAEKICSEPMEKGRCTSNIMRSYFDKQAGRCRFFIYTGCDGNRNNFPTEQDCNRVCGSFQRELRANLSAIMKNFKVSLSSVLSYHIPVQEQQRTKTKRAQHDKTDFGNIQTSSLIMEPSEDIKVDCEVSEWSEWTSCNGCYGYKTSTREIMVPAKGEGRSCPKKTIRRRKCNKDSTCSEYEKRRRSSRDKNSEYEDEHETKHVSVNCKVTHWSTWSGCSATCGNTMRNRVRSVKVRPRGPRARLCPPLVEFKQCPVVECPK